MHIISIAIQKGGSGKTTTAINLGAALQQLGKSVLLMDLDPQANLTQALGLGEPENTLYELLKTEFDGDEADMEAAILKAGDLQVIPASLDLAMVEMEMISIYNRERIIKTMLESLEGKYDYLIIDCPPSISLLTINALTASHYVIMPLQAEFLPLNGVYSFMKTFRKVRKQLNPELAILGMVFTQFSERKSMNRNIFDQLDEEYGPLIFQTKIRTNIALSHAQEWGVDIFNHDKSSNGAFDYMQLAQEVLKRVEA